MNLATSIPQARSQRAVRGPILKSALASLSDGRPVVELGCKVLRDGCNGYDDEPATLFASGPHRTGEQAVRSRNINFRENLLKPKVSPQWVQARFHSKN